MTYTHKILNSAAFKNSLVGMTEEERSRAIAYARDLGARVEEMMNATAEIVKTPEGAAAVREAIIKIYAREDKK